MRVRLTNQLSGTRDGREWPAPGTVLDLPDDEARGLIAGGNAVDPNADSGTVMVPPDGVHQPYTPADAEQAFVPAPADAVADPEGSIKAAQAAADGDVTGVPVGVGAQHPDGTALTPDEIDQSTKAEMDNRERFGQAAPKVGEKADTKTKTK